MKRFALISILALCLASFPASSRAHGGGHDKPEAKPEATLPELPEESFGEESLGGETHDAGSVDYGMGQTNAAGNSPLWGENQEVISPEAPPMDLNQMAGHEGHEMADMPKVKPAEHTWVPTARKGYGWAMGLTLFSGAVFGFLTLRRPCE